MAPPTYGQCIHCHFHNQLVRSCSSCGASVCDYCKRGIFCRYCNPPSPHIQWLQPQYALIDGRNFMRHSDDLARFVEQKIGRPSVQTIAHAEVYTGTMQYSTEFPAFPFTIVLRCMVRVKSTKVYPEPSQQGMSRVVVFGYQRESATCLRYSPPVFVTSTGALIEAIQSLPVDAELSSDQLLSAIANYFN